MESQNTEEMEAPGRIGIYFLKDIWRFYRSLTDPMLTADSVEWKFINGVFNALGIGLEPTMKYLMVESPGFDEFERWIERNGVVSKEMISYFNDVVSKKRPVKFMVEEKVFNELDIKNWNEKGFIILRGAISKTECEESVKFICDELSVDIQNPGTWYSPHPLKQGIMIQLFDSKVLNRNRFSRRIRLAYEQLWEDNALLVSMDRVSFNPPETSSYKFPGPNLHWDVSLKQPIPYGIQGLLYLTDTDVKQGAFTVIPGFHNKIDSWLNELGPSINPRKINLLESFEEKPIAGEAGDLIIWNHCLPHGSRPNNSTSPRIVQYINYQPLNLVSQDEWI